MTSLQALGYTEREAHFLELAALHSGYFVQRQFTAFIGHARGGTAAAFIDKLVVRDHVTIRVCHPQAHIYHLSAKPLYNILGQTDNRHRRRRAPLSIKTKLMALDYVLAHRAEHFLDTEQARVEYFDRHKVDRRLLPCVIYRGRMAGTSTVRYFVEKFPLSVRETDAAPLVTITYIDPGDYSVDAFETFLGRYTGVVRAMPRVRLVFVSDRMRHFGAARARFMIWLQASAAALGVPRDAAGVDQLLRLFAVQHAVEVDDLRSVSVAQIKEFREHRARLATIEGRQLYRLWTASGADAVRDAIAHRHGPEADQKVEFDTYRLSHDYSVVEGANDDQ